MSKRTTKLSSSLQMALGGPGRVVNGTIRFKAPLTSIQANELKRAGVAVRSQIGDVATVGFSTDALFRIIQLPFVIYIDEARQVRLKSKVLARQVKAPSGRKSKYIGSGKSIVAPGMIAKRTKYTGVKAVALTPQQVKERQRKVWQLAQKQFISAQARRRAAAKVKEVVPLRAVMEEDAAKQATPAKAGMGAGGAIALGGAALLGLFMLKG